MAATCRWVRWAWVPLLGVVGCGDGQGTGFDAAGPADGVVATGGATGLTGGASALSGGSSSGGAGTGAAASGGAGTGGVGTGGDAGGAASGGDGLGGGATGGNPAGGCPLSAPTGHFQLEALDRGLVAIAGGAGTYVGWRMLGSEYDAAQPGRVAYRLYRNGAALADVADSTNYLDESGEASDSYAVGLLVDGVECEVSPPAVPWATPYLSIPLDVPAGGTTDRGDSDYTYHANDGSPGDLDGDGRYELVLKWDPTNAKDNSQGGFTGNVLVDAYTLDGERLWRIDLGRNVRAGAHYTQFLVYDLDGDGRAEVAMKTAPGSRDGTGALLHTGPAAADDDAADHRNDSGYVLAGPEYLTVFDGLTGAELATVAYAVARGDVDDWGDGYGNRVDRFLASVGFVSDEGDAGTGSGRPSLLMARGYYTRATVTAYHFREGALTAAWTADSDAPGTGALVGQGAHSMAVADVDGDLAQEIVYGAAMIQSDGSFGCSTGLGHGDALHVGDLVPTRSGLEVFMPHEDKSKPIWDVRGAADCAVIHQSPTTGQDNGRGVAADIFAGSPGAELWSSSDGSLRSATTAEVLGSKPPSTNFLVFWDGDELRELLDGNRIDKGDGTRLLTATGCSSNNGTKSTPTLTADLLGDWREEVVWRTDDDAELRIYTTTAVTTRRIYTLMHDPQYRMQVSSEQTAYNQPPHPGFHLGPDMAPAPAPDLHLP